MHIASTIVNQMSQAEKISLYSELIHVDLDINYHASLLQNHLLYRATLFLEDKFKTAYNKPEDADSFIRMILAKSYPGGLYSL